MFVDLRLCVLEPLAVDGAVHHDAHAVALAVPGSKQRTCAKRKHVSHWRGSATLRLVRGVH